MLEILQFYVSSFPAWLGITIGLVVFSQILSDFFEALVRLLRPASSDKGRGRKP